MTAAGLGPGEFAWAAGIEDTCVYPPEHFAMADLDEYDLTEHTENWRDDLRAVRDLGATVVRYGVNWPLVHTAPGTFDWSMLDERLRYAADELGLTVIADLVHYGTPTWLRASFADARYPQTVAEFAGAFAARYRGIVDHVTPLNEPLTTASFCGLRGVWPPSLTGWDGWTAVTLGVVEGMAETIRAVRAANPDAVVVHVEASSLYRTDDPALAGHAALLESVGMLPTDLLLGRVDASHPLHGWLLEQGAAPERLERLTAAPPTVDLLGVNYYPDLSPRTLVQRGEEVAQVATNRWSDGLADSLRAFSARYGLPMLITETSIEGDDEVRSAWLDDSVRSIGELRDEGLDIRGYTWWPVFDFVDWSYASGGRNVEEFVVDDDIVAARQHSGDGIRPKTPFLRRMGVIRLDEQADGRLARVPTAAAALYARLAAESVAETGEEVADELAL
ncbi:family 1 glycosylhydrolase [Leifsonia shinshuensis]|uniref:Glycoside hydrolase family 1 protein n=1 Tax=Leifsonia shinshuensis TaxID=150026 RepID=A0A7G6YFQ8_9MICO|nr:family 1 glycosylhydrolase [Leifsonia shinshuensis]QNE37323.1 glycoside hydrolase family 1 protein [Leifsonia shinshuensis]